MRYLPMVCPRKNMKECGEYSRDRRSIGAGGCERSCSSVRCLFHVGARSDACGCEGVARWREATLAGAKATLVGARVGCLLVRGGLVVGARGLLVGARGAGCRVG